MQWNQLPHTPAAMPSPPMMHWALKLGYPWVASVGNCVPDKAVRGVTNTAHPVGNAFISDPLSEGWKAYVPNWFSQRKPDCINNQSSLGKKNSPLWTSGQNAYPYFPKSDTVVPPTGTAFPGPYTSHIVKATWAFLGRSGYFTGSFSHSFQLWKQSQENKHVSFFRISPLKKWFSQRRKLQKD